MKSNIYISRKVLNYQDIVEWARNAGFDTMMPEESLHVTVVYCKHIVDWSLVERDQPEMIYVPHDEDELREVHNFNAGACVLEIQVPELTKRNKKLRELGIHSKFPDYRAHITITYQKPDWINVEEVEPYRGCIVLGPEIVERATNDWKEGFEEIELKKPVMVSEDVNLDSDQLYDIFKTSYDDATGKSWSREKFMSRASNWTFYGNDKGFVAFREQSSGMRKLVGVAGDSSGVVLGLKQLKDEGKPVWGAVSDKLARAAKRFGFIAPHLLPGGKLAIKTLVSMIPKSVFGGITPEVTSDGGVTLSYDDIGDTKKFLIGNREYFSTLVNDERFLRHIDNKLVVAFIKRLVK